MQITEMRSSLNADNKKRGGLPELPEMPDWVVRHIYEKRHGLPLTKLPDAIARRSVNGVQSKPETDEVEDMTRLHLRYKNLFN